MIKVIKGGMKVLSNMTKEEKEFIKSDLTLDNPTYAQVKKYSRYKYTNVPPYITFYKNDGEDLVVPRGYKIPFDYEVVEDYTVERKTLYPKFKLNLRDTQREAFEAWKKDTDNGTIVLSTGKGKSILGCYLAYHTKQKALVIVQKTDLINSWTSDFCDCFGVSRDRVGTIQGKNVKIGSQITVATIQTLSKLKPEVLRSLYDKFGMIIQDECLEKDTLILLEDGGFKTIDTVVNDDKLVGGLVSNKFSRKSKKYILKTSTTELIGSPTHPTWIWSDDKSKFVEKCLKDIKVGDYIPNLVKIPHTTKYNWTPEQLAFVALIQTDGHMDKEPSNRIKINVSKDFEYYEDTFRCGVDSFIKDNLIPNVQVKKSVDCRGNLTIWVISKELRELLNSTFSIPFGKKSNSLVINEQIQYAPLHSIKSYIETVFSVEGDLDLSRSARLNLGMCSKNFIQGFSLLLRKFSIITNYQVITRKNAKHNNLYRISISGHFFNEFMDKFKLLDRKHTSYRNKAKSRGIYFGEYYMTKVTKSYLTDEEIDVYDFTTTSHSFIANGVKTHNCHHSPAKSYEILRYFQAKYFIALTATDMRTDGLERVINFMFGEVAYRNIVTGDDPDIMPYKVIIRKSNIKYEPTPTYTYKGKTINAQEAHILKESGKYVTRNPLNINELRDVIKNDRGFNTIVANDIISEYKKGKSCVAFFHTKDHTRALQELLVSFGVPSSQIQLFYGDSKEDDKTLIDRAESKEVLITLATYSKLSEGSNIKSLERGFLVSSVNNEVGVIQSVGRLRRTKKGKKDVIIYDYHHEGITGIRNHINTRLKVYKAQGAIIEGMSTSAKSTRFTRGFKRA